MAGSQIRLHITHWLGDEPYCVVCSHYHSGACLCADCGQPTPCRQHYVDGTVSTQAVPS